VIVLLEKRINGEETLDCSDGYEEEDERRLSVSFSFPHFKPIFTLLSSFSFFCYSLLHESQSSSCIFILFFPFMAGE
jgi:hypothetical protein